jgi:hypothetical protein
MSEPNHIRPTDSITRRHMLGAGAAVAAGAALTTGATGALGTVPAGSIGPLSPAGLVTITALREHWYAASSKAADLECRNEDPNFGAYEAAEKEADELWEKCQQLTAELATKPVTGWDDIVIRAENCRLSCALEFDLYGRDGQNGMLTALLEGIFSVAGCMPPAKEEPAGVPPGMVLANPLTPAEWEEMTIDSWLAYDISFVGQLMAACFGTDGTFERAAGWFDVPVAAIQAWSREEYIPLRWHSQVYGKLRDTGLTLAPHILGLTEKEARGLSVHAIG